MHLNYSVTFTTFYVHTFTQSCFHHFLFSLQVVLECGDVLFVPRHWWHYVECIDPAVSVNTWIEVVRISQYMYQHSNVSVTYCVVQPEDARERVKEGIARTLVCEIVNLVFV